MLKASKCYVLILMFTLFIGSVVADESDDNPSRDQIQIYRLFDDVSVVSTVKISYGLHRVVAKSVFPKLECESNENVIDPMNQLITAFIEHQTEEFKDRVNQFFANKGKAKINNTLYLDYDSSTIRAADSNHLISVRFSIQGNIAGKEPYHYHRVINYDFDNNRVIELGDLFYPDADYLSVMSDYVQHALYRRLSNPELIGQGTKPTDDNFKNWNLKPNGLLVTFDEAQVAPEIQGAQTVLIPYTVFRRMIPPTSPIAWCIKNPRTCARTNVVTGGFIDEMT